MQKKSKIEVIPWKQSGWTRIKDAQKEVPPAVREFLESIMDKFGCQIIAVREQK